jgi:hypothetical protein
LGTDADTALIGAFEDEFGPNSAQVARWLALPEGKRPTAFAIGAGNRAWQALEAGLATKGERLSLERGGFAGAGITSSPFSLMFGEADVFQGIEIDNLARYVTPGLIRALADTGAHQHIHRFQPSLSRAQSLGIQLGGAR